MIVDCSGILELEVRVRNQCSVASPHHAAVTKAVMVPAPDTMNPAVLRLSVKLGMRINY